MFSSQAISNFLSPQVAAIFLLGFFWQRTNEPGAFWGLMVGFAFGILRFALEFGYFIPPCGSDLPDLRPAFVKHFVDDIHYLHYGALLFLATGVVTVGVSLLTPPIPAQRLHRLTFWTRHSRYCRLSCRFSFVTAAIKIMVAHCCTLFLKSSGYRYLPIILAVMANLSQFRRPTCFLREAII